MYKRQVGSCVFRVSRPVVMLAASGRVSAVIIAKVRVEGVAMPPWLPGGPFGRVLMGKVDSRSGAAAVAEIEAGVPGAAASASEWTVVRSPVSSAEDRSLALAATASESGAVTAKRPSAGSLTLAAMALESTVSTMAV